MNLDFKADKATNLRALFSTFIEKRLLRWDSNPHPPAFKAVVPPTEPPRQPSWLVQITHTSYTVYTFMQDKVSNLALINRESDRKSDRERETERGTE